MTSKELSEQIFDRFKEHIGYPQEAVFAIGLQTDIANMLERYESEDYKRIADENSNLVDDVERMRAEIQDLEDKLSALGQ